MMTSPYCLCAARPSLCPAQFSEHHGFDREGPPRLHYTRRNLFSDPQEQSIHLELRTSFGVLEYFDGVLKLMADGRDGLVVVTVPNGHMQQAVWTAGNDVVGQAAQQRARASGHN